MVKNDYLEFYEKHKISPVKQNIVDISLHYERRRKLYRQCGLPERAFKNAQILEIGPGSGYNSLYFLKIISNSVGGGYLDLVEANSVGISDIKKLFAEQNVDKSLYTIHNSTIENYSSYKKYDVVIAEGFLFNLRNQDEIIAKLKSFVAEHGIIVITCSDHVCMFVEAMKRLLAQIISRDITDFEAKVDYLAKIFEPQLKTLKGVSRSAKDWVCDQILNPAGVNGAELSLADAIEKFGDEYFVLGSSPSMFTDYSWYKDIWVNQRKNFTAQFKEKRLSLLLAGTFKVSMPEYKSEKLVKGFESIKFLANEYEQNRSDELVTKIAEELKALEAEAVALPEDFQAILKEIVDAVDFVNNNNPSNLPWKKYKHFFGAFGRTMQYIAFEKR